MIPEPQPRHVRAIYGSGAVIALLALAIWGLAATFGRGTDAPRVLGPIALVLALAGLVVLFRWARGSSDPRYRLPYLNLDRREPRTVTVGDEPPQRLELADPDRRVAAWLLDGVIATILLLPFLLGMRLTGTLDNGSLDLPSFYAWGITGTLIIVAVLIHMEGERGATPGKRLMGIRVIDEGTGAVIGWKRDLVRRLMFIVEGLPFYLGFASMFRDPEFQAWHDRVAKSFVIRISALPAATASA